MGKQSEPNTRTSVKHESITIFAPACEKHLSSYDRSRLITHLEFCQFEQKRNAKMGRKTEIITDDRTGFVALCNA
jgi:hypothetical protein